MKKLALIVAVLMIAGSLCSCANEPIWDGSSGGTEKESSSISAQNELLFYEPQNLHHPVKATGFDAPILSPLDDTRLIYIDMYYNGKAYTSGLYAFLEEYEGRYYFWSFEQYAKEGNNDKFGFISSCYADVQDFKNHGSVYQQLREKAGPHLVMYNGIIYSFVDNKLCSYSLEGDRKDVIYDGECSAYCIDFTSNDWIFFEKQGL